MVTILRIGHRINRDKRISTHLALVARAFGAEQLIIAGDHDEKLLETMSKIVLEWGGDFKLQMISYNGWNAVLNQWKEKKKKIIHLTMYGENLITFEKTEEYRKIKNQSKNLMIVLGGEKVPGKVFKYADWNIAINNQPHSEVSSLAVFLDHFISNALEISFDNPKKRILPSLRGLKQYI
ncbi:MAG: tRNA (cytidine(56)-2'-O)-methyltransferase [Candidatus Hodarchaeales archaeon]